VSTDSDPLTAESALASALLCASLFAVDDLASGTGSEPVSAGALANRSDRRVKASLRRFATAVADGAALPLLEAAGPDPVEGVAAPAGSARGLVGDNMRKRTT